MRQLKLAGDTVMDWVISDKQIKCTVGGVGNVYRGLLKHGIPSIVTTLYNPTYPVVEMMKLHPQSISDPNYQDVYIRNYDEGIFRRFREGLRPRTLTLKDQHVVVAHKDSCIKTFESWYADVRDPELKGETFILRMSSTDDWQKIMKNVEHNYAIITFDDRVTLLTRGEGQDFHFEKVRSVDDIGAGDTFNVGLIASAVQNEGGGLENDIKAGIALAQKKVQRVGVFFE